MSGLILPGDRPARTPTLYVPKGLETRSVVGKCEVPGCGLTFYAGEEERWQRHVGKCARRNLEKIREQMRELPVMSEENWNPDAMRHLRQVGKRMIAEKRLEMHPHEKIYNE